MAELDLHIEGRRVAANDDGVDVILISQRGQRLETGYCRECRSYQSPVWTYRESNHGRVSLCSRCKPEVFDRSFGRLDALDHAPSVYPLAREPDEDTGEARKVTSTCIKCHAPIQREGPTWLHTATMSAAAIVCSACNWRGDASVASVCPRCDKAGVLRLHHRATPE